MDEKSVQRHDLSRRRKNCHPPSSKTHRETRDRERQLPSVFVFVPLLVLLFKFPHKQDESCSSDTEECFEREDKQGNEGEQCGLVMSFGGRDVLETGFVK